MASSSRPTAQPSTSNSSPAPSRSSSSSSMNVAYAAAMHPMDQYRLFSREHASSKSNPSRSTQSITHSPSSSFDSRSARSRPSFDSSSASGSINNAKGSPTSSLTPLLSFRPKAGASKPPACYVRPPSPSTIDPTIDTPTSPLFPHLDEEEHRRRQLRKLARTLGEDIPAELILRGPASRHSTTLPRGLQNPTYLAAKDFPDPPTQTVGDTVRRRRDKKRRASVSLSNFTAKLLASQQHAHTTSTASDEYYDGPDYPDSHRTRPREKSLPRPESMALTPITFAFPSHLFPADDGGDDRAVGADDEEPPTPVEPLTRSKSFSHSERQQHHSHAHTPSDPINDPFLRPDTPFMDSAARHDHPNIMRQEASVVRRERRQGWSGEWNQHDMKDVIQKLRSLR